MTALSSHGLCCPICATASIYSDGGTVCSLLCAKKRAIECHTSFDMSLEEALAVVETESHSLGLPDVPRNDKYRYRYIFVEEKRSAMYWQIDRALIERGIDVEYLQVTPQFTSRARLYRIEAQDLSRLPDWMNDYHVTSTKEEPPSLDFWYFLSAA